MYSRTRIKKMINELNVLKSNKPTQEILDLKNQLTAANEKIAVLEKNLAATDIKVVSIEDSLKETAAEVGK